jgi:hypothetical protein
MGQQTDHYPGDPGTGTYPKPADRPEQESIATEKVLNELSQDVDRCTTDEVEPEKQTGLLQPMVWTMLLLVVLLGGWTFLVPDSKLEPQPLDEETFRNVPEILQVKLLPTEVLGYINFNRWVKMTPQGKIDLVEKVSRIASVSGYERVILSSSDGTVLARWHHKKGMEILYPEPESVSVQLP